MHQSRWWSFVCVSVLIVISSVHAAAGTVIGVANPKYLVISKVNGMSAQSMVWLRITFTAGANAQLCLTSKAEYDQGTCASPLGEASGGYSVFTVVNAANIGNFGGVLWVKKTGSGQGGVNFSLVIE